ncbi:efflux transporter, RND family, MFP subunit [Alkaliphilus metalliredigens QYMF]|uniref:Efflux transporter, RND family, MFP subunit n=1 Tax=Alkaliphilus metalliredigens (strain QYMF) TaxID=293826 RepID=A6TKV9_ALKMQ|nr:efflux RND transporter periplasmic adaptor subunit [Alkaliphilus metalliredigens]ABR46827.1 efflux transporter, RND family, MFP subunit [Alkaliphilus metalliredigens QYMF]
MKKKIIGAIIIVIVLGAAAFFMMNRGIVVEVEMAAVTQGNIAKYVEELGVVKTKNQASVYADTAGRVTDVLVKEGEQVNTGDVLVRLDSQQLSRQKRELEAQRLGIIAQYNEATQSIDEKEIEKLELEIEVIERRIKEAKRVVENNKRLYEAGAISYEEYNITVTSLEAEQSNLEGVQLDLELIKKPISENISAQYEAQLRQLDIQMEALESQSGDFVITAHMSGTVLMKAVEKGSYVQPGVPLLEIGDTEILYIESDLLIGDIANVEVGAPVIISNKDLRIIDLQGTVTKIHPQAFSSVSDLGIEQKRIKVDIEFEGSVAILRPGYDLDVNIIIESKENVLLIPENAIFQQAGRDFVFVNVNEQAILREIEKGIESQRRVEIVSGLQKGDQVIVSPSGELEEGVQIKSK